MDYDHNMDHHIQIISHDRDYSNVDVHEQAMLSTKAEERPTEKHLKSKMLARCMLGNAWLAHFLMIYCVSLFNLVRPLGLINNKDGELENCCPASWNVEAKSTIGAKGDAIASAWKVCLAFSSVEKYHQKWKELKDFSFFPGQNKQKQNWNLLD